MNEINVSIKRKTNTYSKLMQHIDIHTSYPYCNITFKNKEIHIPVIEIELSSTDRNDIENVFESFCKDFKNKWRKLYGQANIHQ